MGDGAVWKLTVALTPLPTPLPSLVNSTYMSCCVALTTAGSAGPEARNSRGADRSAPLNTDTKSRPDCVAKP